MTELNKIYNEDCFITMERFSQNSADVILTSPFYNTNRKQGKSAVIKETAYKEYEKCPYIRYDKHVDNMTNNEYCGFTKTLFLKFDRILRKNGVVLYNLSYGNNNREGMFRAVNTVITETPFTIADVIVWKKKSAYPNCCSPNKLTRIWEFIFVFCRKAETETFHCNKAVTSIRATGQKNYENIFNYIEAKNNDGVCPYNRSTFSTDLVKQLLNIYLPKDRESIVYDPFMGSGTTAAACKQFENCRYIGSEISENQVKWAEERLNRFETNINETVNQKSII
ncbi:MAG: site-specific DNA-methyltransferase [Clostridiales bacterium]|nr:site-specific DNA-methyltransferase [Clostridiales bacterium]